MDPHVIDDELSMPGAQALLASSSAAHLAYTVEDGTPRVVMDDQMARIAITPNWVRFYDFGAGRMPQFLNELVERNDSNRS
jgi:hypothetical protein